MLIDFSAIVLSLKILDCENVDTMMYSKMAIVPSLLSGYLSGYHALPPPWIVKRISRPPSFLDI